MEIMAYAVVQRRPKGLPGYVIRIVTTTDHMGTTLEERLPHVKADAMDMLADFAKRVPYTFHNGGVLIVDED